MCPYCGGLHVLGRWVWSGRVVVSGSVVSVSMVSSRLALVLLGGDLVFGLALEEWLVWRGGAAELLFCDDVGGADGDGVVRVWPLLGEGGVRSVWVEVCGRVPFPLL